MKRFRPVLFWAHLTAGVVAGIVILVMSVTGVALTYQRQMQLWADTRHYQAAPPQGATRLPAARLIEAAAAYEPSLTPTLVTLRSSPSAPAAVALGTKTVYVNPYTAHVYGEGTGAGVRAFFAEMVVWHRYLAMSGESRPVGRAITGTSNLLFLALVLSGMYLWWPRSISWVQVRQVVWFRGGLPAKARNFNWHNVLGFWSALPLALVVYGGVIISYPWASNMVYQAFGEAPPAPAAGRAGGPGGRVGGDGRGGRGAGEGQAGGGSRGSGPATPTTQLTAPVAVRAVVPPAVVADVDMLLQKATAYEPGWTILAARIPTEAGGTTTVTVDRGDGGQPQSRGTLTLDVATGSVRNWDGFSTQTPGRRARSFLRFAHTGEVFGIAGQTIAGLVSAAGAVLVYTGLALSLRRFREWRARRRMSTVLAA